MNPVHPPLHSSEADLPVAERLEKLAMHPTPMNLMNPVNPPLRSSEEDLPLAERLEKLETYLCDFSRPAEDEEDLAIQKRVQEPYEVCTTTNVM